MIIDPLSLYACTREASAILQRATMYSTPISVFLGLLVLLLAGLVRQHDALGETRRRVVALGAVIVAAVQGRHQTPRRARRDQAFVNEAAHGVHVDVAVGRVVLDVRRIGEQDQLHPHTPLGPSAGELLDVLTRDRGS